MRKCGLCFGRRQVGLPFKGQHCHDYLPVWRDLHCCRRLLTHRPALVIDGDWSCRHWPWQSLSELWLTTSWECGRHAPQGFWIWLYRCSLWSMLHPRSSSSSPGCRSPLEWPEPRPLVWGTSAARPPCCTGRQLQTQCDQSQPAQPQGFLFADNFKANTSCNAIQRLLLTLPAQINCPYAYVFANSGKRPCKNELTTLSVALHHSLADGMWQRAAGLR